MFLFQLHIDPQPLPLFFSVAPAQHIDFTGSINGLVVITSAVLAIVQFVNNEDRRFFDKTRKKINRIELPGLDETTQGLQEETCKELRLKKDELLAFESLSPRLIIGVLLCLLPLYALMHAGVHLCPIGEQWLSLALKIASGLIVLAAVGMVGWILWRVRSKKRFSQDATDFFKMAKSFLAGFGDNTFQDQQENNNAPTYTATYDMSHLSKLF